MTGDSSRPLGTSQTIEFGDWGFGELFDRNGEGGRGHPVVRMGLLVDLLCAWEHL